MYKNMSFKAWIKQFSKFNAIISYLEMNNPRRILEKEHLLERESSEDEEPRIQVDGEIYEYITDKDESCEQSDIDQDSVEQTEPN